LIPETTHRAFWLSSGMGIDAAGAKFAVPATAPKNVDKFAFRPRI
jgi:hypothetical protein